MVGAIAKRSDDESKPDWAKKKLSDYSDADMERLLDQWNVSHSFCLIESLNSISIDAIVEQEDEEEEDPDDLPEHLRPSQPIDMSKVDMSNPESLLKQSKKGKTVMTFVTVSGNPTRLEAEELTKIWQTGLWNNQIQAERWVKQIESNRTFLIVQFFIRQIYDWR